MCKNSHIFFKVFTELFCYVDIGKKVLEKLWKLLSALEKENNSDLI